MTAKNIVIAIIVLALIGGIGYFILNKNTGDTAINTNETTTPSEETIPDEPKDEVVTDPEVTSPVRGNKTTISTLPTTGNKITAYHFGTGKTEILFIGGVHGSYSGNTITLAEELIDYLDDNPEVVPENITVTVIPALNVDGILDKSITKTEALRIASRFNTNEVDLNRNFDCEWSEEAVWRNQKVSGGGEPFSEVEADALKDYVQTYDPSAVVVWFSAEGKVYPSACGGAPSQKSVELAATFATAAGYPAAAEFNAYAITGDMVNWMAKKGIPAISVLLTDHENTEWIKNKAGVEAILKAYTK